MSEIHLRKYGVEATFTFPLYEIDGVDLRIDAVHASGDSAIMKDEGAEANTSNGFSDEGNGYSIVLTATEMEAARIVVYLVDQTGTKVWLDRTLVIETYGNASAQHAMDFDDSVRGGLSALPNAAADAAGGLPISDNGGLDLDSKLAHTNEITVARMGALTDWINGGRLDLLLDAIPTTPMRGTDSAATEAKQDIIDTNIDDIEALLALMAGSGFVSATHSLEAIIDTGNSDWLTGGGGAAPTVGEIRTEMDDNSTKLSDIVADTNELQADDTPGALSAIDAKIDTIDGVVDEIVIDTGTTLPAAIAALNNISVADIIAGIADGSYDFREMTRIMFAILSGITTDGGTKFRDSANTKNRVIAVTDANKNRTAMTLDGS